MKLRHAFVGVLLLALAAGASRSAPVSGTIGAPSDVFVPLDVGEVLTVTSPSVGSNGNAYVYEAPAGSPAGATQSISDAATVTIGPFQTSKRVDIRPNIGTLSYSVTTAAAAVVSPVTGSAPSGNVSSTFGGSVQGAIVNLPSTGGSVYIPHGNYSHTAPIMLSSGITLNGELVTAGGSYLTGSQIAPSVNLPSLLTQPDLTNILVSNNINKLIFNGCATITTQCPTAFTTAALVALTLENSTVSQNVFTNSSGDGLHLTESAAGNAWVNWLHDNSFLGNQGNGLYAEASDSLYEGNYLSGNGVGAYLKVSSLRLAFNQFERSTTDGIDLYNYSGPPNSASGVITIGNFFNLNVTSDIHFKVNTAVGTAHAVRGPVVANSFHSSAGVLVDSNVTGGLFVGDYFTNSTIATNPYAIKFNADGAGTQNNQYWQLIGVSSDIAPATRFQNLPVDAQVISGGPGGAFNILQSLVISSGTVAVPSPEAAFEAFGSSTLLGDANVIARFGVGRASSLDATLLIGSANGVAPYIDAANGENSTATKFGIRFQGTEYANLSSSAINLEQATYFTKSIGGTNPTTMGTYGTIGGNFSGSGLEFDLISTVTSGPGISLYQMTSSSASTRMAQFTTTADRFFETVDFHYAGTTTCTVTGSVAVQINGVAHTIPYC